MTRGGRGRRPRVSRRLRSRSPLIISACAVVDDRPVSGSGHGQPSARFQSTEPAATTIHTAARVTAEVVEVAVVVKYRQSVRLGRDRDEQVGNLAAALADASPLANAVPAADDERELRWSRRSTNTESASINRSHSRDCALSSRGTKARATAAKSRPVMAHRWHIRRHPGGVRRRRRPHTDQPQRSTDRPSSGCA